MIRTRALPFTYSPVINIDSTTLMFGNSGCVFNYWPDIPEVHTDRYLIKFTASYECWTMLRQTA